MEQPDTAIITLLRQPEVKPSNTVQKSLTSLANTSAMSILQGTSEADCSCRETTLHYPEHSAQNSHVSQ